VTETRSGWRGARARIVAAGLTIALAPLPLAAAAESDRPAGSTTLNAAVAKAASSERLASAATAAQPAQPTGAPSLESKRFFKTPLGMAVIAIVGAGTAYAVYSAQHDRIHSAVR